MMKYHLRSVTILYLCGFSFFLLSGCTETAQSGVEDDHLEHHIPEHKPDSFSATVKEVDTRMRTLLENNHADTYQVHKQELTDIISWIPEMAADSELKHTAWNEVKQISGNLKNVFKQIDFEDADANLVNQYFLLVDKLNQFSARSEPIKFSDSN
tara:strand:+ start:73855 stop:74319 length:465 start_codon:yes stop_codon:yes gene_type:complete